MDLNLSKKIILVTGGAKGIGEGITRVLAAEGAFPVIIGRNANDNQELIKAIGTGAEVTAALQDPDQCAAAVNAVVARFGRIDGVVNNAGINDGISLEHGSYEGFIQSLHNNLVRAMFQ